MATFTETFKRKEMKYVLDRAQAQHMEGALRGRMVPDAFGRSRVSSVYFDTPERWLIARSLEKPLYKEKLRVRWYDSGAGRHGAGRVLFGGAAAGADAIESAGAQTGMAGVAPDALVFTELKKKFKGIVYKRRVGTSAAAARAWAQGMPYADACAAFPLPDADAQAEALSTCSRQIAREIDAMRRRHGPLAAAALITCERTAHVEPASELRITFDTQLAGTPLDAPRARAHALLPEGCAVMEVKSAGPLPLWLVHAMNACEARPRSFSKYGELHKAMRERSFACSIVG